jgi:hypothetical protein
MCVGVDEWSETRAREWWQTHRDRIRGLTTSRGSATMVSGQTLSMELSALGAPRK